MEEENQENPKTILEFAQAVKAMGTEGLAKEFAAIRMKNPKLSFTIAKDPLNIKRNRYVFFLSCDQGRVALLEKTGDGDSASDFINANYVDGYEQKNAFIATQGLIDLNRFWIGLMIENLWEF